MTTTAYAIRAEALTRVFERPAGAPVTAVDRLSLDVPTGVVFGFLGPNGAGKTTTIRLLLGLLEPTGGRATVLGFDAREHAAEIRAHSGALLEHAGIYERLSAEDNLEFYARAWHMPAGERRARIKDLLQGFDLWERRDQDAGQWSRGMKQKLAVARAMLHRPRLLFLDEPTAGFDPVAAAALGADLVGLARREGTTVFLTTHNLDEAERVCDLLAVIRDGRLLVVGTPDDVRARAGNGGTRVEISASGLDERLLALVRAQPQVVAVEDVNGHLRVDVQRGARVAPLVRLLVEQGAEVEEVRKGSPSLQQAYLELMGETDQRDTGAPE